MEANWLDSYYEALEFFYWEPQHIGRKKNVDSEFNTIEKVVKHLRRIEVTLNHNINQFLILAPAALRACLFGEESWPGVRAELRNAWSWRRH